MYKRQFIALADYISEFNRQARKAEYSLGRRTFNDEQLACLADFCQAQNPNFNRERWLGYIAGECGPCGGKPQAGGPGRRITKEKSAAY